MLGDTDSKIWPYIANVSLTLVIITKFLFEFIYFLEKYNKIEKTHLNKLKSSYLIFPNTFVTIKMHIFSLEKKKIKYYEKKT